MAPWRGMYAYIDTYIHRCSDLKLSICSIMINGAKVDDVYIHTHIHIRTHIHTSQPPTYFWSKTWTNFRETSGCLHTQPWRCMAYALLHTCIHLDAFTLSLDDAWYTRSYIHAYIWMPSHSALTMHGIRAVTYMHTSGCLHTQPDIHIEW